MQDDNKNNPPAGGQAEEQVQTPVPDLPEKVEETSNETPIEVPNKPQEHPMEEAIAKESIPAEEFKKEEEAEEKVEEVPAEEVKEVKLSSAKASEGQVKEVPEEHPGAKWYIIHTYSGHENRVQKSLKQRIQSLGFEDRIFDIIVPTRNTIKVSQGKKESIKEKIFPGYVLVKMILDDESWLLVRTTQGVTAFIGAGNKPTPISEKEVEAIQKFMNAEEPLYKTAFSVGEAVKITDGPFNDFLGTIDAIDEARGKLKVLVSIFGRETPVELDFLQVKKL